MRASAPAAILAVYTLGVLIGLLKIDAPIRARLALALVWPLGPLAFVITISTLLAASLVAFPLLGAIVLAALLAASVFAQEPLKAQFIGNMAFAISDGRITLFTDFPYQSGYGGYMKYNAREIKSATPLSIAVITHRHADHWDKGLFEKTNWAVIAPEDALAETPPSRVMRSLPVAPALMSVTFSAITVEGIPTPHAMIGHYSYLVTWNGRRLYFTGDTDDAARLLEMKNLDVAFVSPWLFSRTQKGGQRIDARQIVIYHHKAGEAVPGCAAACSVPKQGETLLLR